MAFPYTNIQTFIRHCIEPHVVSLKTILRLGFKQSRTDLDTEITAVRLGFKQSRTDLDTEITALKQLLDAKFASIEKYDLGEFYLFRHPILKPGFAPLQGGVIRGVYQGKNITEWPIWEYLQTADGQLLLKTEAQWQAMTTATWHTNADGTKVGWNGIGGAPFYVQDLGAGTLRMPDLRGMYAEAVGFNSLGVGEGRGDQGREAAGTLGPFVGGQNSATYGYGVFTRSGQNGSYGIAGGGAVCANLSFSLARVQPTGPAFAPRRWGALACCYLGQPA